MKFARTELSVTFLALGACLVVLASCSAQNSRTSSDEIAKRGKDAVYWGVFSNARSLDRMERNYGAKPSIIMQFSDWRADFPPCGHISALGMMPLVVWEPWYAGNMDSITLADIESGKWDQYIQKWGKDAASFGKPVMVRWGHEMNGNWYPWSGPRNGNNPALYVSTYRRVHDLVVKAGAKNVIWLWSPNANSVPEAEFNLAEAYYPGDDYVDWIAVDGYNWGASKDTSSWQSFDEIFAKPFSDIARYAPSKPIMVGEVASTSKGGDKKAWIADFFSVVKYTYPNLRAWVWFNQNKETDWSFDSDKAMLEAFKAGLSDTLYAEGKNDLSRYHRNFR